MKTADEKSFDALRTKKQTGHPAKLSSEELAQIKSVLEKDAPKEYGYSVWDDPSLLNILVR